MKRLPTTIKEWRKPMSNTPEYTTIPDTMKAITIDRFGGRDELTLHTIPLPDVDPDEVLIRVDTAGVGVWDPLDREGAFAEMMEVEPSFPYALGSDGAGTVAAVGERVSRFTPGDRVYAYTHPNTKSRFYAEYIAVTADNVSSIPEKLPIEQASVMAVGAITALHGLDEALNLAEDETLLIFGASGGIGHMAVQLAKRMGTRVFAVATGDDGVALVERLGADAVVDGHTDDVAAAANEFAPDGLDAALLTAGGEVAERALEAIRDGGRVAYPNGVMPEPQARPGMSVQNYDAVLDREAIDTLNRLIEAGPFTVHVARTYSLEEVAEAHRALDGHYLGKLALKLADTGDNE